MASDASNSQPAGPAVAPANQLTLNLQVVSPSVGVNHPLQFPGLAAATTIRQLKGKIRESLPVLAPADDDQRLIYRGRALARDTDSLQDIFGVDSLQSSDQQTIHLVIKDSGDSRIPAPSVRTSVRGHSPMSRPASATRQSPALPPHAAHPAQPPFGPQPMPGFARRSPFQTTPNTFPQPQVAQMTPNPFPHPMPSPGPGGHQTPEQAAAFQQQHQNMTHWLTHLQREAMTRAMVNQNQRGRAQMGMRGIGDPAGNNGQPTETTSGRASPAPVHTVYRETIGPNGQSYQVETIIRSSGPSTQAGLSPADVHNIIRAADATQATQTMTNAMQRSASGASLHNRPLTQPGVTTPIFPTGVSRPGSERAPSNPGSRSPSVGRMAATTGPPSSQPRPGLEVYILASPEGPRALLMNNHTSETYYTPRLGTTAQHRNLPALTEMVNQLYSNTQNRHNTQQPPAAMQPAPGGHDAAQAQQEPPVAIQDRAAGLAHPHNPVPAAGMAPFLVQMVPHIWLLIRLAVFVWILAPGASWSRWIAIVTLAVFVFLFSTGLLNRFADHAWRPLARHLENLLPGLDRPNARAAPGDEQRQAGAEVPNQDPDPAQMAARMVADRQGDETWLTGQVRRLERAGLLFLASLAPGVAERHIANLEAQEQAERQRREAEAAAATAAAEAEREAQAETEARTENGEEQAPEAEATAVTSAVDVGEQQSQGQLRATAAANAE